MSAQKKGFFSKLKGLFTTFVPVAMFDVEKYVAVVVDVKKNVLVGKTWARETQDCEWEIDVRECLKKELPLLECDGQLGNLVWFALEEFGTDMENMCDLSSSERVCFYLEGIALKKMGKCDLELCGSILGGRFISINRDVMQLSNLSS